jgi:hypothetical protein
MLRRLDEIDGKLMNVLRVQQEMNVALALSLKVEM